MSRKQLTASVFENYTKVACVLYTHTSRRLSSQAKRRENATYEGLSAPKVAPPTLWWMGFNGGEERTTQCWVICRRRSTCKPRETSTTISTTKQQLKRGNSVFRQSTPWLLGRKLRREDSDPNVFPNLTRGVVDLSPEKTWHSSPGTSPRHLSGSGPGSRREGMGEGSHVECLSRLIIDIERILQHAEYSNPYSATWVLFQASLYHTKKRCCPPSRMVSSPQQPALMGFYVSSKPFRHNRRDIC